MTVKNITKANTLTAQYSTVIQNQVRYYASKRASKDSAFYDELYSETLVYVYSRIGTFDIDKATIQTYVARLAEQGVKRYFQSLYREASSKKQTYEYMASVEYFTGTDKAIEQIETEAVLDAFIAYLREQKRFGEIRYINATLLYGYMSKQKAAEILRVSQSTVMRMVNSIRLFAHKWSQVEKRQLAWY